MGRFKSWFLGDNPESRRQKAADLCGKISDELALWMKPYTLVEETDEKAADTLRGGSIWAFVEEGYDFQRRMKPYLDADHSASEPMSSSLLKNADQWTITSKITRMKLLPKSSEIVVLTNHLPAPTDDELGHWIKQKGMPDRWQPLMQEQIRTMSQALDRPGF